MRISQGPVGDEDNNNLGISDVGWGGGRTEEVLIFANNAAPGMLENRWPDVWALSY